MPAWLTVYCRKPLHAMDAERLSLGITHRDPEAPAGVDYPTLAEGYDIDEDDAAAALSALTVREDRGGLEVFYGPTRPLVLHRWTARERVVEEIAECREVRAPPASVGDRLDATAEVVGIEMGFSQLEDMGIVLAFEIARWLAQRGDGLIVDDEDHWYLADAGALQAVED